jgi:hypothetical protein
LRISGACLPAVQKFKSETTAWFHSSNVLLTTAAVQWQHLWQLPHPLAGALDLTSFHACHPYSLPLQKMTLGVVIISAAILAAGLYGDKPAAIVTGFLYMLN